MEMAEVPSIPLAAAIVIASFIWSEIVEDCDLVLGLLGEDGPLLFAAGGAEDVGDVSCSTGHLLLFPVLDLVDKAGSIGADSGCLTATEITSHWTEESGWDAPDESLSEGGSATGKTSLCLAPDKILILRN